MARRTPGRCRYRRRPLVAALPLPAWEQHARPGAADDDEAAATFSAPVDCEMTAAGILRLARAFNRVSRSARLADDAVAELAAHWEKP